MLNPRRVWVSRWMAGLLAIGGFVSSAGAQQGSAAASRLSTAPHRALVDQYCLGCHNSGLRTAGLELDSINQQELGENWEAWEKVVRKLRARLMPPSGRRRPDEATYRAALASLEASLDRLAVATPNPGRTDTFRRLNRTEYRNAIRDLLALDVDVTTLLPSDSASYGFDNVTVGNLPPSLLERYVGAAEKISRLAVGRADGPPGGATFRTRPDLTQEKHVEGLPIGTRGGVAVPYTFPADGEYEIRIRLARDRNEHVEGMSESHELELLLDRERIHVFTVEPPASQVENVPLNYQPSQDNLDGHLRLRIAVTAGPHILAATFPQKPWVLLETSRQPYESHFNYYRHPRVQPAIYSVSIVGPYDGEVADETPSRRRVFSCHPESSVEEDDCAEDILKSLMRRAYRRPVNDEDLQGPLEIYRAAKRDNGFEAGIEMVVAAVLVSPEFLFRIEQAPAGLEPQTPYRVSDLELASRLSFFLWSSLPDDVLLDVAARGELSKPAILEQQTRRMLKDPRALNLVTNFASQWLHLRNLEAITPDKRMYPDFDDNLRQAFRRETELFVESILREDRSVLDLLRANYTFVNERLAKHYGIPHIYGSRFRRVTFGEDATRGGLLRHGSILALTSYATRTSPVVRGNWILGNILGVPAPPPPPDIPDLQETRSIGKELSMRQRLAEHRANPVCASCHKLMDPIGFALENYDAIGRFRTVEAGVPIDTSGELWDGTKFDGPSELEEVLLRRPELFLTTLTEKLLVFATGRGVEYYDGPAIRQLLREAQADDYSFSALVVGIVNSMPFQMRRSS